MPTILKKIAIVIFVAFVLFLGIILFFQQNTLNKIKSQVSKLENASSGGKANSVPGNPVAPGIPTEKNESPKTFPFPGEIKSVAADNIDIEAQIVKAKNIDKMQGNNQKGFKPNPDDYELVKKIVKVSLNGKTQYSGIKKEDLKAGDKIFVTADNSPFVVDSLTALKITNWKE